MKGYALVVLVKDDAEQVYIINPKTLSSLSEIRNSVKEWIRTHETELQPGDVRIQVAPADLEPSQGDEPAWLIQAITANW